VFNLFGKSDSQIQQDVMNELKWDPSVTPTGINVTSMDGIVTLRGTVPHYFEKITAEDATRRVRGVRALADELEVNLMGSYERSDEDIARAALSALEWNYQIPQGVSVTAEKGWVTLRGDADWAYERTAAENAVGRLMGVRGVTNSIALRPGVQSSDIKTRIEEALKRSAESDGRKVSVAVDGAQVTLSGNLESYAEIEDARLAAWNAPGVTSVKDNLKLAH
jgi:osmotically-inducible protein OsmY